MSQFLSLMLKSFSVAALCTAMVRDAAGAGTVFDIPERHRPLTVMGRDYWPALYRYGDWAAYRPWASPARLVRFDNPSITNLPAFRDVVPIFYARNPPPPADGKKGIWERFEENFLPNEPDREILTANPHPDRPFILWATGKRSLVSYAGEQKLDFADYRAWKAAHTNHVFDGVCDEWDIDHDYAWLNAASIKDPERRKAVETWLGEKPRTRYERADKLRRFFANRKKACYDGDMYVCISHVLSSHLAADCGAKYLNLQTTSTCEKDEFGYRWNVSGMFARGAARQFGIKWEWYHAGYMNGWTHDGQWWDNAVTVYPESDKAPEHYTSSGSLWPWHCGPEFGTSANALERMLYFAWLSGPNFSELEEWSAQYLRWDKRRKRTELTCRGRDYVRFYDFAVSHRRGVPYTPVAICVPVAQGYPAWGGYSSAMPEYGYTPGDRAVDAVFFTVVPGFDRNAELHRGREYSLFNSPFANMYDVIAPDAPSQNEKEKLEVFRSYKALVVVGDYPDRSFEKILSEYERQGGRVIRIASDAVPQSPYPTTKRAIEEVVSGREKFPQLEKLFDGLQADYFPFRVEGDLLYGVNRLDDGWIFYAFNNKGVTKFADRPHSIDHAFDTEVTVTSALADIHSANELTQGEGVRVENGSFSFSLPAGEFRIFEIK